MSVISDEDLMLRLQEEDDGEAFAELFRRYRARITSYTCRLVRDVNEGENLAQETFLRMLQKRNLYNYPRKLSTWLFTIARNLVTDFQKKKRAMTSEAFDLMADAQSDSDSWRPDFAAMEEESLRMLHGAIESLPAQHREVLVLRAFHDMSYREIAEIVDCPESTARSRMDYALKELRGLWERMERKKAGNP
ncbi:MAG: sigma-70 family RNA polymerase sigma factor [Planctomycetes bacterium]|nr:sigma-70 family RNA polymerase sigma factor [Planctomycetota bacterium]